MAETDVLARSAVFEGFARETIDLLCSCGRVVRFEAGHRLFECGERAEELMILQEGAVELHCPVQIIGVTRDLILERLEPEAVLAWRAMVNPYTFTVGARCAADSVLVALSRDALHGFFEKEHAAGYLFMRNLAGVIGRRLQAMQAMWVRELQTTTAHRMD